MFSDSIYLNKDTIMKALKCKCSAYDSRSMSSGNARKFVCIRIILA